MNTDIVYCYLNPKPSKKCDNCIRNLNNYDIWGIRKVDIYLTYFIPTLENGKCLMFKRKK